MPTEVLIVGLPVALRRRLEARARRADVHIASILIDIGDKRTPYLLPHPSSAIHSVKEYTKKAADARVLVLPYAAVPSEVTDELIALSDLQLGHVELIQEDTGDWPQFIKKEGFNEKFLNSLFRTIESRLFEDLYETPSQILLRASEACPSIKIASGALDQCDQIARHRWGFIKAIADALLKLCEMRGAVGPVAEFFEGRGIDYAHTGGISVALEVICGDGVVVRKKSNIHLKRGDKTTPQAAVRCYFEMVQAGDDYFVVISYAGPHPESDINVTLVL